MLLFSKRVFLLLCVAALLAGEAVCDGAKAKSKKKSSKKKGGRAAKEEPPAFSREQFEKVIQKGSLKKFSGMLDSIGEGNPVINQQNFGRDGKTLVIHAAEHGATDILKLLLANGGDLHRADSDGWTALMWALRGEHWKATDVLLEHSEATSGGLLKALNARTKNGLSPVLLTVHSVKLAPGAKMFKKLIDLGAVVSVKNDDGEGCFIRVCQAGDTELVKLLIEKGVDVNEKDESDVTGLMYAIVFGHDDLAKFIVAQEGSDQHVNHADVMGKTALMHAVGGSSIELIQLLLEHGAKVEGVNKFKEADGQEYELNVLDQAKRANRNEKVIALLQEHLDKAPEKGEL